jgi:SAM-dependent methyltransferase
MRSLCRLLYRGGKRAGLCPVFRGERGPRWRMRCTTIRLWPRSMTGIAHVARTTTGFFHWSRGPGRYWTLAAAPGSSPPPWLRGGAEVVGADPAGPMLAIARARDWGDRVTWVQADARTLDLGRQFDAVMMTGHAFQTLLTRADRDAVLGVIRRHLAPGGRFLFDSRNPEAREWESWGPGASYEVLPHPDHGMVERWNDAWQEAPGLVTYETHYRLPDGRHLQARSRIAFPGFEELNELIAGAGLVVERWAGDATGGPLRPGCPDFIPIGFRMD